MGEGTDPIDAILTGTDAFGCLGSKSPPIGDAGEIQHSLRRILPTCRFLASDDLLFRSIAASAETSLPGQLVVYRIGKDCPSRLIADAIARGAAGILTEQILPCPLPQCIVGDVDLALARIAAHQQNRPDRELLNVAVVGSAGKTSTTLLIASLLRACGIRTAYQSSLGQCDGVVQTSESTPMPIGAELVEWLSEAVDNECKASIVEIPEDKARHGHFDAVEFDIVVVTGSTTCDGDFGPSALQCILDRLTPEGVVIAPADDARVMRAIRESGIRPVTYGIRKAADITAKIIDQSGGMTTLLVSHRDTTAVMETSLCGPAMASNHAAATLLGLLLAQPLQDVLEKLSQLRSIPGRGQRLASSCHPTVILESGGSPDRIANALRTHRSMKAGGRLWCVMAIDEHLGAQQLAEFGSQMERYSDHAIVTSTLEHKRRFLTASHCVLDGVQQVASFRLIADRERAIQWAISEARPNDTIVLFTNERHSSAQRERADLEYLAKKVEEFNMTLEYKF